MRITAALGLGLFAWSLAAQPALVSRAVTQADTCPGKAGVTSVSVEPSREVLVAIAGARWSDDEMRMIRQQIGSLYTAANRADPLRLALLIDGKLQFAGPFKTRAQLQTALNELAATPPGPSEPESPVSFYSTLANAAPQLGSDWSTLVLIAQFPAVAPELSAYTEGWFSDRLRAAKLRVSYWTPSGRPRKSWMRSRPLPADRASPRAWPALHPR